MSEPRLPGDLPPDVSPEYAEAYRRAYLRALSGAGEKDPADAEETQQIDRLDALFADPPPEDRRSPSDDEYVGDPDEPRRVPYDTLFAEAPAAPPAEPYDAPADEPYDEPIHRDPDAERRPAWLVPALLAGMVVLLLAAAYGAGTLFSSSVDDNAAADGEPSGIVMGEDGSTSASPDGKDSPKPKKPKGKVYEGRTEAAAIGSADASCQAPSSVDAAGNPVRYPPSNAYDGDLSTAWRCNGDGVGQTLQLNLSDTVEIGQLGIVPGYAKTDPRSGADRYAQNNRLTKVRWTFPDGTSVVQKLDGSPRNRDMQTKAIPLVEANTVTLEVLASTGNKRNTIAVSEIRIGAAD